MKSNQTMEHKKMPWSIKDTIENMEFLKKELQRKVIEVDFERKGKSDAEEVAFDFDRAINALIENREYKKLGTLEEIRDAVDAQYTNVGKWIPADQPPETDETEMSDYILLSFENFPVPLVGIYELDEEGNGAYYVGDSEKSCISQGYAVNAWMTLPEQYKGGQDE